LENILKKIDELAQVTGENATAMWLDRIAFVFLFLMFVFAPHSIAATQTAWLIGMLAAFLRLFFAPKLKLLRTSLDFSLLALIGWTILTCFTSYAPDISIDKLRNVFVFLIFYFVFNVVRTRAAVYVLAFALIASCMVNVIWTPIDRLIGRGVEIHGVRAESPLAKAQLIDRDTLLEANGKKLRRAEEVLSEIERNETTKVKLYRPDYYFEVEVKRADLLDGSDANTKLGIESWKKSLNWRSAGFYGHYTTYAEVLQLIASLLFGILLASISSSEPARKVFGFLKRREIFFAGSLLAMMLALLLTVTRASQLGFLISASTMMILGARKKIILISALLIIPLIIGGLLFLQHSRGVGFFDSKDDSTNYRRTVWREGISLATSSTRNAVFGVGMDSIKRYARDWKLFDNGRLPMGHFHSTPVQLIVERGFASLLLWIWFLFEALRRIYRGAKNEKSDWRARGVLLGTFGGMIGFISGGMVHYNLGDTEVAMIFFALIGLSFAILKTSEKDSYVPVLSN